MVRAPGDRGQTTTAPGVGELQGEAKGGAVQVESGKETTAGGGGVGVGRLGRRGHQ